MLLALLCIPLVAGLALLVIPHATLRRGLLVATALTHLALSIGVFWQVRANRPVHSMALLRDIIEPDALGTLFLLLASILFVAAAIYAVGYLRNEDKGHALRKDFQDGSAYTNAPEQRFTACLCFFLAAMTLVTTSSHMGVLWVGIEMTTLSSAPLIYFHRHRRSLEATWKYLMICSVGIALALLGNLLFTLAFSQHGAPSARFADMITLAEQSRHLTGAGMSDHIPWLKAAFIFLLVGYGTKMGLAPLHNWLPDAHSQAPSLVSALLSGALLNCAFLGILRGHQVLLAAGLADFSGSLLIFLGLVSMVVAAVFIVGQGHYKRLLAYSSVEHMGILALGVGLGGGAVFGSMLHAVNHSLTKCMLFLLAGNILHLYHTHSNYDARGLRWTMPITATLWMLGFLAITGSPPFGLFVSEFSILKAMLAQEAWGITALYLGVLGILFVGMSVPILRMVQGPKPPAIKDSFQETCWNVGPPIILGLMVLTLGLYIPNWLQDFLHSAAQHIGG